MRLIFCGGGTAGHVTPGIAIAEYMKKIDSKTEILYVGRVGGEENFAVEKRGLPISLIEISGIERKLTVKNFKNVFRAIKALGAAKKILKDFCPDAVVGTGGYVCWPMLRTASKMGIPTLIHESNATPGMVTRLLSKSADRVLLNYAAAKDELKRKDNVRVVGNPVIDSSESINRKAARKTLGIPEGPILISSFGGSGGSQVINDSIVSLMKSYSKNKSIIHLHSSGTKYFEKIKTTHPMLTEKNANCRILPYIENAPTVMAASDIVISRCGAMTISELAACGAAAILVPSPNVANNHQYKNAKMLSDANAAILIEEKDLSYDRLNAAVRTLMENVKLRKSLGEKIHRFYSHDAKEKIAREIYLSIKGG